METKKSIMNGKPNSGNEMEYRVTKIIHSMGIPATMRGYYYLRTAVLMALEDSEIIYSVTKVLYPAVAGMYRTTPPRVERAIRRAIDSAWDRGDADVISACFGDEGKRCDRKPTNREVIAAIADSLSIQ